MINAEFIIDTIVEVKQSHTWMLESIKHKADEALDGNYSDELKHAILAQEMLDMIDG